MTDASTSENVSPELMKVVERAQREPEGRFHSLAHLIDVPALMRAYHRIRKDGAVGVDGVTKEQYGQKLQENLENLHARLKAKQYRHQPIRRVHIPKDNGKTRPIGISAFEDRVVQDAIREVLQAIYEQDFLDCSHGFRPGRSAHDAIRALDRVVHRGEVNWVLEADIVSYFDSLDRTELMKLIQIRVADGSLLRLIGKCLHVGVLDGADYTEPEKGTIQGSGLSPLLGNIYLHYVLDLWFEREVKPRLSGKATLIRYADDLVITFENQDDAKRVMEVLGAPATDNQVHRRLVSGQPTQAGQGATRSALPTHPGALQLLRRQRQLSLSVAGAAGSKARLVQVAPPSESKNASELGEVFGTTQAFPSSASQYPCPNLGRLATSHTDGGAVWWKSPSTDLARARSGRPLLATLVRRAWRPTESEKSHVRQIIEVGNRKAKADRDVTWR
jgi:group II intron reverse transcriptase/maturase